MLHPLTELLRKKNLTLPHDNYRVDDVILHYLQERDEGEKTFVEKLFSLKERLNHQFPTAQAFWAEFIKTADKIADEHFCKDKKQSASKEECQHINKSGGSGNCPITCTDCGYIFFSQQPEIKLPNDKDENEFNVCQQMGCHTLSNGQKFCPKHDPLFLPKQPEIKLPKKIVIKGKVFKEDNDICRTINEIIDYLDYLSKKG